MRASARTTGSSGPAHPGQGGPGCESALPCRQTRARHVAHLKCAIESSALGGAEPLVGRSRGALELAQAARAARLGAVDADAVEGESVAGVARLRLEPGPGWVTGWHGRPSIQRLRGRRVATPLSCGR